MLTYFLHLFHFLKSRSCEFSCPCRWWRQMIVNNVFYFFLSRLFSVCDCRCGPAAATLHPLSPHGGRVVLTKQSAAVVSVSERVIHAKLSPKHFKSQLCREHVHLKKSCMEARWRVATCRSKRELESLRRDFAGTSSNPPTSERQRWRRRKKLRGWASLWGGGRRRDVWQPPSIESGIELIIWAVIRRRGKEWVNEEHSFIKSSFLQFSIALFLSLRTSLVDTMMKSLFWLASFCLITFNEWQMIYHSNGSH